MGAPKPTLGYPSRTEAVLALRAQGLSTAAVAERIGISEPCVAALECSAGRSPKHRRRAFRPRGRTVLLPVGVFDTLRPHADARAIAPSELAAQIVATVARDGLVEAVLDDEVISHPLR